MFMKRVRQLIPVSCLYAIFWPTLVYVDTRLLSAGVELLSKYAGKRSGTAARWAKALDKNLIREAPPRLDKIF